MLRDIYCPVVRSDVTCYWKDMWRRLDNMRRKGQLCDVTLISGDNASFTAHAAVLSASSDMFNIQFVSRIYPADCLKGSSKIVLNDVPGEVLRTTLDFIYGITPQTSDDFERLKIGALHFGIPGASDYCDRHLAKTKDVVDWTSSSLLAPASRCDYAPRVPHHGESRQYAVVDSRTQGFTQTPDSVDNLKNNADNTHYQKCQKFQNENDTLTSISVVASSTCPPVFSSAIDIVSSDAFVVNSTIMLPSQRAITTADIVSRRCQGMTPPSDVVHNAMMTRMSITDLTRPIECPHLKKMLNGGPSESFNFELSNAIDSENPDTLTIDTDSDNDDSLAGISTVEEERLSLGTHSSSTSVKDITFTEVERFNAVSLSSFHSMPCTRGQFSITENYKQHTVGEEKNGPNRFPTPASNFHAKNSDLIHRDEISGGTLASGTPAVSNAIMNGMFSIVQPIGKGTVEVPSLSVSNNLRPISTMISPQFFSSTYNNSQINSVTVTSTSPDRLHENKSYFVFPTVSTAPAPTSQNVSRSSLSDLERVNPYWKNKIVATTFSSSEHKYGADISTNHEWPLLSNHVIKPNRNNANVDNSFTQFQNGSIILSHNNPSVCSTTIADDNHCNSDMTVGSVGLTTVNTWSLRHSSLPYEQLPVIELSECIQSTNVYCQSSNLPANESSTSVQSMNVYCKTSNQQDRKSEIDNNIQLLDAGVDSKVNSQPVINPPTMALRELTCSECPLVFATVHKLHVHELKVHSKGKLFTCDKCNFRSPRKKDVQAHMLSQHNYVPPGVRIFTCNECAYKCIDKNRFQEHEAMHTGAPVHKCTLCNKSYTTRRGMRTHLKYHSADRPHRCEQCSATFKVRAKLVDHIKLLHEQKGVKAFKCRYCAHTSALRGNCNQHIRKYHVGKAIDVIDLLAEQRRRVKDYDYAGLEGERIAETKDIGSVARRCTDGRGLSDIGVE